jgi:hypothetical protein
MKDDGLISGNNNGDVGLGVRGYGIGYRGDGYGTGIGKLINGNRSVGLGSVGLGHGLRSNGYRNSAIHDGIASGSPRVLYGRINQIEDFDRVNPRYGQSFGARYGNKLDNGYGHDFGYGHGGVQRNVGLNYGRRSSLSGIRGRPYGSELHVGERGYTSGRYGSGYGLGYGLNYGGHGVGGYGLDSGMLHDW